MEDQNTAFPIDEIKRVDAGKEKNDWILPVVLRVTGILLTVAAIVIVVSMVLCPIVTVAGDSASPQYSNGDMVLFVKDFHVKRGELCCIKWQNKLLFKRIIAVGGDTVDMDGNGNVFVNGVLVEEKYVVNRELGACDIEWPYEVPEGRYFILSDDRSDHADSRCVEIGVIEKKQILGEVVGLIWPWT